MNKKLLIQQLQYQLSILLEEAELAAKNARLAATDEQSKAETQYDTLAIESGFLAEGQSRRIEELKANINALALFETGTMNAAMIGAIVVLEDGSGTLKLFFILPVGAGHQLTIDDNSLTVITPEAPLSTALKGCYVDDEVHLKIAGKETTYTVINIQ